MIRKIVLASIISMSLTGVSIADNGLVVFRGIDGQLTEQSKSNLKQLRRTAKATGTITVWVSFDLDYVADPSLRTQSVITQEAAAKLQVFNEIVAPLISRGDATEVDPNFSPEAPGCLLSVNDKALRKLAHNNSVKHISHMVAT